MTQEQQKALQTIEINFRKSVSTGGWEIENVVQTYKALTDLVQSLSAKPQEGAEPEMEVLSADHIGTTPRTPKG